MNLEIDDDVKSVLEMMIHNIPTNRLVAVADAVQKIAPILWGQYEAEVIQPISLRHPPISLGDQQIQ